MACKPDFVRGFLPWMTIPLDDRSRVASSRQPGSLGAKLPCQPGCPAGARSLFGVAPGGACRAGPVASPAVGSYPTVSPLPRPRPGRSVLCGAFPGVTPAGRYPAPLLHGVRTFLGPPALRWSGASGRRGHPAIRARQGIGERHRKVNPRRRTAPGVSGIRLQFRYCARRWRWLYASRRQPLAPAVG